MWGSLPPLFFLFSLKTRYLLFKFLLLLGGSSQHQDRMAVSPFCIVFLWVEGSNERTWCRMVPRGSSTQEITAVASRCYSLPCRAGCALSLPLRAPLFPQAARAPWPAFKSTQANTPQTGITLSCLHEWRAIQHSFLLSLVPFVQARFTWLLPLCAGK